MTILPLLLGVFGFITAVLWLVIGWRAMKAHEELAVNSVLIREELRRIADGASGDGKIL